MKGGYLRHGRWPDAVVGIGGLLGFLAEISFKIVIAPVIVGIAAIVVIGGNRLNPVEAIFEIVIVIAADQSVIVASVIATSSMVIMVKAAVAEAVGERAVAADPAIAGGAKGRADGDATSPEGGEGTLVFLSLTANGLPFADDAEDPDDVRCEGGAPSGLPESLPDGGSRFSPGRGDGRSFFRKGEFRMLPTPLSEGDAGGGSRGCCGC